MILFLDMAARISIVSFLILLLAISASSQDYIGKTKVKLVKELKSLPGEPQVIDDSVFKIRFVDQNAGNVVKLFRFDKSGKCFSEEVIASCDSCFHGLLNIVLGKKKYEWKKINENQYISKYSEFMMIELPVEPGDFSFSVFHTEWNKELYRMLTGN
jgi:hypothetical protein